MACGLPTNVVTLCSPRENAQWEPPTATAVFDARLSAEEVTHGVTEQGAAPEMYTDSEVAL
jgi:hypothetical protein